MLWRAGIGVARACFCDLIYRGRTKLSDAPTLWLAQDGSTPREPGHDWGLERGYTSEHEVSMLGDDWTLLVHALHARAPAMIRLLSGSRRGPPNPFVMRPPFRRMISRHLSGNSLHKPTNPAPSDARNSEEFMKSWTACAGVAFPTVQGYLAHCTVGQITAVRSRGPRCLARFAQPRAAADNDSDAETRKVEAAAAA